MEITLQSKVNKDRFTDYIQSTYDLKVEDIAEVKIPNNIRLDRLGEWNIGVICGASGSGKSTILKSLGEITEPHFDNNKPLISNFEPMSPQEASELLCSMGLASVPTWIRPYNSLSNGEKYRAEVAYKVSIGNGGGQTILIDEYTSVVDRNVAKSMSNALAKYIRREKKKIILATCHYDILEWLQPDWIYDLNKGGTLERGDYLRHEPIQLQIYRTEPDTWDIFKKHHYMTSDLNKSAQCFCFTWNNQLVGFASVIPLFGYGIHDSVRFHRVVVLPDFQGLGIGKTMVNFLGGIFKADGKKMFIKTINPRLGLFFKSSNDWEMSKHSEKLRKNLENSDPHTQSHLSRPSFCAKYIGKAIEGFSDIVKPIDTLRYEKSMEGQLSLW